MPSSEPSSSQHLKFPPVRVDHSLTDLDLETLMMRSTQRQMPEEAANPLEESGYDLLSDSIMDMSDDEAHTASIASTDGPTPDESSDDFSEDDVEYETDEKHLQDSVYSSHPDPTEQGADARPLTAWDDSTLTEVPPYLTASESSWQITLEEQAATDKDDVIEGCKVIKSSADYTDELPQVFSRYGCGEVRLSVQAALSHRPLPTPDSYRILYIGLPEKWAEEITTVQIGTALGACPSASKSVMVRGQIEPYVPVPQVDHCVKLDMAGPLEKPTHVLATLEDGRQVKFEADVPPSLYRPDLVVVCYRSFPDPTTDGQDIASARKMFDAANIPCIDLAQVVPHGTASRLDDSTALRVRAEGRDDPNADWELKAVLPLDHRSFSRLDPYQLNRHLALISPHLMKAQDEKDYKKTQTSWFGRKVKTFMKKIAPQGYLMRMLASALVLCVLIPALFHGAAFTPILFREGLQSISTVSVPPEMPDNSATSAPGLATLSVTRITSASVTPALRGGLSVVTQTPKSKDKHTRGFEIETIAEHQFVLRPSKAFTSCRKKPQLQIQVSRQSQVVPVRYNRTVSGEYIVHLEQQYPFDTFNVSIATHSKPLLRQSFEIMLGHNMSTLDQLLVTVKSGILNTQHTLLNISGSTAQQMRAYMAGLDVNVMTASEQLRNVRQTVQRRLALDTHSAKKVPEAAWVGLREVTAPVRTSSSMKRARMNALRVRCKVEMAAGLSTKGTDGKQSWACLKVHEEL